MIALLGSLALAAVPATAAASSTYGWALSCKGYGFGDAYWEWTSNGVPISNRSGLTGCEGDQKSSASGLTRPAGADGITVYLFAGYTEGGPILGDSKVSEKSFKVDASFNFKSSITFTDTSYAVKLQYTVSLTLTG